MQFKDFNSFKKARKFVRALKFSNNDVEVVLGFKNRDGEILEDCIEENTNSTTKFSQID